MKWELSVLFSLLPGCAWDSGHGFSTIDSAAVSASFEPESARSLDEAVLSDLGYLITPQEFELAIASVELESLAGAGQAQSFDPANPPPGYALCHGGHCHADDGALVPYEEIEVELAGGTAAFQSVVSLEVARALDALAWESVAVETLVPSAELPETELRRATVAVTRVSLHFLVSGAELGAETLQVDIDTALPMRLAGSLDFTVDRQAPARIEVAVGVRLTARLFDGVDFGAVGPGSVAPDDPDDALLLELSTNLAAAEVTAIIQEANEQ